MRCTIMYNKIFVVLCYKNTIHKTVLEESALILKLTFKF